MEKRLLEQIQSRPFIEDPTYVVSDQDVIDFIAFYVQVNNEEKTYHGSMQNRKMQATGLEEKYRQLFLMAKQVTKEFQRRRLQYGNYSKDLSEASITDSEKFLEIILAITKRHCDKYGVVKINVAMPKEKDEPSVERELLLLGNLESFALLGLSVSNSMDLEQAIYLLQYLSKFKYSFILEGDCPIPFAGDAWFKTGTAGMLKCVLKDDILQKALVGLTAYMEENGVDISHISTEDLARAIDEEKMGEAKKLHTSWDGSVVSTETI